MDLRKITRLSMLLALSVVLNLIESAIPFIGNIIPGIKLGLANTIVIFVIFMYGFKEAMFLSITRVLLVGILRTGLFNMIFMFSLSGAIFSVISMFIAKKYTKLSVVGVSILGAIMHSIGQIIIAIFMLNSNIIFYLPYLLILSVPTGIIVGLAAKRY
jgi:heptaprenyl diphosphate synthase